MSSAPPPGGQFSPDGKWWWDGTRWVPTSGQLAPGYPAAAYPSSAHTNSMAIASLVSGILAWILCPFVGAILAIIFGFIARGQIKSTGEAGGGMAIAGIILGFAHLVVSVIAIVIWVALVGGIAMMGAFGHFPSPTP